MEKHILIDRDGVINADSPNSILKVSQFQFLPGALDAIQLLTQQNYKVHIISNQSAIGRGNLDWETLNAITRVFTVSVKAAGGEIASVQYCPHRPDEGCNCRKPKPGMIKNLGSMYRFTPHKTYFIGDKLSDVECGKNAGCRTVLVNSGLITYDNSQQFKPEQAPDYIVDDLLTAVHKVVLKDSKGNPYHELCGQIP